MTDFTGRSLAAIREAASYDSDRRARAIVNREFGGCPPGTILEAYRQVDELRAARRTTEARLRAEYRAAATPIRQAAKATPIRPARESRPAPAGAKLMRATEEMPYRAVPDCPRGDAA